MQAMWSMATGVQIEPAGQGFIGAIVATLHFVASFYMSRRKRRNEPFWPTRRMIHLYMASGLFGAFWGVALLIWDIMTATATQWEGFYRGNMKKGTLYFEAVLGIAYSAICTIGLLLVCDGCNCKDPRQARPRSYVAETVAASSIRPDADLNQSVSWNSPNPNIRRTDRPTGTPPPVYSSKRNRRKQKNRKKNQQQRPENGGQNNPAYYDSNHQLPGPGAQRNFGPPSHSEWI